jgi:glycosyltransferase involved in cell wall biosynthesis
MQQEGFIPRNRTLVPLEVSVVMPCFNESKHIESLLRAWSASLEQTVPSFEILVVNDGSKDGTGRILDRLRKEIKSLRVIHQLHLGSDSAARRGFGESRGKYILHLPANSHYEPSEFLTLWQEINHCHLVIARRIRRLDGILSEIASFCLGRFTSLIFGSKIKDPGAPFRLFQKEAVLPLLGRLGPNSSILNIAMSLLVEQDSPGFVKEVGVPTPASRALLRHRRPSIFEGFLIFRQLLSLRLHALKIMKSPVSLIPAPTSA